MGRQALFTGRLCVLPWNEVLTFFSFKSIYCRLAGKHNTHPAIERVGSKDAIDKEAQFYILTPLNQRESPSSNQS